MPPVSPVGTPPLTPRERGTAILAARGLTNREIADRLVISVRTVDNHLHHTSTKLGIDGRDELAPILLVESDLAPTVAGGSWWDPLGSGGPRRARPRNGRSGMPILLVWGEHDRVFRPVDREAEIGWWRDYCPCEVSAWTQPDTGHELQIHRSMPALTRTIVGWLRARGL